MLACSIVRSRAPMRGLRLALVVLAALGLTAGCSGGDGEADAADAGSSGGQDVTQPADATQDTGPDVAQGSLKWALYSPDGTEKMRAVAPRPGKPGQYVVVGDGASVMRFEGTAFKDLSPASIGKSNLRAVWAGAGGQIAVAGEGNALLVHDGEDWISAQLNPTAPVTFRGVHGPDAGHLWAVGEGRSAFQLQEATWLPVEVSVSADGGEAIAASANFVAVHALTADDVWIAADKGTKAEGVAVHRVGGSWKGYALPVAPRDIWAAPGADKDPAGKVFVVGGTAEPYVATFDGQGFKALSSDVLNWKQGFTAVRGLDADQVWAAALKGQLRRKGAQTWEVVDIASAPGVVPSFSVTKDLVGLALHGPQEMVALTAFGLYRYGVQP